MRSEVRTTGGTVRGTVTDGLAAFLGIPYAEPPSGELRFQAPRVRAPWDGVLDATRFSPSPPQAADVSVPPPPEGVPADDYLSVNVWTPAEDGERLPVLVWVYGGGFVAGTSADPSFEPSTLARQARVVVVSMNYRVGVEGFGLIEGAPPNRGLLDVVAALEWAEANVAAFGGDPGNLTVYGQSAGAGTVAALLSMPANERFWSRAILSSVPCLYFTPALAASCGEKIAAAAGVANTVEEMARVAPDALVRAMDEVAEEQPGFRSWGRAAHGTPMGPVVDGEVLPLAPWQALADGALAGKPLLIGHTRDEFTLFMHRWGILGEITPEQAETALSGLAPRGGADYRAAFPDASPQELYTLVNSDWMFRMPTIRLAQLHQGPTYLYELAHTVPVADGRLGAPHCSDLPLVFGDFREGLGIELYAGEPSPDDRRLGEMMRAAWASFLLDGDPGWTPYDLDEQPARIFTSAESVVTAPYPETASQAVWDGFPWEAMDLRE